MRFLGLSGTATPNPKKGGGAEIRLRCRNGVGALGCEPACPQPRHRGFNLAVGRVRTTIVCKEECICIFEDPDPWTLKLKA